MALLEKPIWSLDGSTLSNVLVDNLYKTYNVVTTWWDGTPMDDTKIDSSFVYVKYEGKYLRRNEPLGQVLQKDTMVQMRTLSLEEILLLRLGVYKHVQLNGYYAKGDTPLSIEYKLGESTDSDDAGSVIKITSPLPITLIHDFTGTSIDIRYFGVFPNTADDYSTRIQRVFFLAQTSEKAFIPKGTYNIKTIGSADNAQFLFDRGGIKVYSNTRIDFEKGAIFKAIPNNFKAYNLLRVWRSNNVIINNPTLVGDRYAHIAEGTSVWYDYFPSTAYPVGRYVFWNNYGLKVTTSGTTSTTPPNFTGAVIGGSITNGSVTFEIVSLNVGEWGYGIFIGGCTNVEVNNANISDMWGDGIDLNYANEEALISNVNIRLNNIFSTNNRRQGMSIETGKGIYVTYSSFTETNGTSPQSGIDIEPWNPTAICEDIYIENCYFKNNRANGINVNFPTLKNVNILNNRFEADSGKTSTHIYHTYEGGDNNEVNINGNDFDATTDNILTNAGFGNVTNNIFRNQVKLTTVNGWTAREYVISDNIFKGVLAQVFQEHGTNTKTIIQNNIFYEGFINVLRGKSDIKGNLFKGGNNTAVQIYTNAGDVVIDGNTFENKASCVANRKNVEFINNVVKQCTDLMFIFTNVSNYTRVVGNYILNVAGASCINFDNVNNLRNSFFSDNNIISSSSVKPNLINQFRNITDSIGKNNMYIVNGVAITENPNNLSSGLKEGQMVYFWGNSTRSVITAVAGDGTYTFAPITTQAAYLDPTTATTAQIVQALQAANVIKPTA